MDWGALLMTILPYVLTFLVGLVVKSPVYQSSKALLKSIDKALEDDKITQEELLDIKNKIEALLKAKK